MRRQLLRETQVPEGTIQPWNRSWFYCAPGGRIALINLIAIHTVTIVGLIFLPVPSIGVLIGSFALAFLGALGTTVVYHRSLTHRGVQLNPWIEQLLIFFSIFNGGGTPRGWVSTHRVHHATTDTANDVSSPHYGGFWWAHIRWIYQTEQVSVERYCPELNRPKYIFWERAYAPIVLVSGFFGLIWGLGPWIWLGPLRMVITLHGQFCVNSVCHLGDPATSSTRARGSSINVWWLTPLFMGLGENWHSNHHGDQLNPRLGVKPLQLDMGWWAIRALQLIGLAKITRIVRDRAN